MKTKHYLLLSWLCLFGFGIGIFAFVDKQPTQAQEIEILRLLSAVDHNRSMQYFCLYWSERYKRAEMVLDEEEFAKFRRDAPREFDPSSQKYKADAKEYEKKADTLYEKLKAKAVDICGKDGVMSFGEERIIKCGY